MSPFHWHSGTSPRNEEMAILSGGDISPSRFVVSPADALRACGKRPVIRRMDLLNFDGTPYYLCWQSKGESLLVRADETGHSPTTQLPIGDIVAASINLLPGYQPVSHTLLDAYDLYCVDKNHNSAKGQSI